MTRLAPAGTDRRSMARRGSMLVLALAVAACSSSALTRVDADTADNLIQSEPGLVVLDIRTPEETSTGTLPQAVELDFSSPSFRSGLEDLDRAAPYLVYCRSGNRSASAVSLMADMGFERVYELEGGIISWVEAGLALTTG